MVKGTLKIDTPICNLGEADDSVKVLVLPHFRTLKLKPKDTVISRQCVGPDPVAKVKSIVCTEQFADKTIQIPQGVQTAAEHLKKLLPDRFQPPVGGSITKDVTFSAGDFEFRLVGTVSASLSQVSFEGLRACFTVPNGIDGEPGVPPFITNESQDFDDPSMASSVAAASGLWLRCLRAGAAGGRNGDGRPLELITVSSLDAVGTVKVVDAQCQVTVDKGLINPGAGALPDGNGGFLIAPGARATYRVRVGNTGSAPLENLTIGEVATLTGQPALAQPIVSTCVSVTQPALNSCFIPRLETNEILDFDVTVLGATGHAVRAVVQHRDGQRAVGAEVQPDGLQRPEGDQAADRRRERAPDLAVDPSGAPVLKPGESVKFRVRVENTGNVTQTFVLSDTARLVDPLPVTPTGPIFQQSSTLTNFAPGASQDFELSRSPPRPIARAARGWKTRQRRRAPPQRRCTSSTASRTCKSPSGASTRPSPAACRLPARPAR